MSGFEQFATAEALREYLIEDAKRRYNSQFGQPGYGYDYPIFTRTFSDPSALASTTEGAIAAAPPASPSFTTTNTQVDGVDEADLVETDGRFIYQVNGQLLTIVDAQDASELTIASQFSLDPLVAVDRPTDKSTTDASVADRLMFPASGGSINGMYLWGDRLTVISSGWDYSPLPPFDSASSLSRIAYPYNPSTPYVEVTVFDVSDPTALNVVEQSTLEGSLVSSRAVEDEVYVVTRNNFYLPSPKLTEDPISQPQATESTIRPLSGLPIESTPEVTSRDITIQPAISRPSIYPYPYPRGTYETEEAYFDRVEGQILDLALPNVETVDGNGNAVVSEFLTQPTNVYMPLDKESSQLTTLSTFDINDNNLGVDASTSVPTNYVNQVFASKENLYLIKQVYSGGTTETEILQLDLETSELVAKGRVPGRIDSQFSVDEHDGFLRITTTTGFGEESSNNLYVLKPDSTKLDVVGKVEGLAPGERIFSTRFQGDVAFVVTFRQVDPLFTIDLSNPTRPEVKGELKVPGFSEYLQVVSEGDTGDAQANQRTLLIGVGRDADPETGRAEALKVSLFDVTDLENPTEVDSYIFEGDFTASEALWDHKAITYSAENKLLAIPTRSYDRSTYTNETNLHVFKVEGDRGLTSLGEVAQDDNWINRSLFIEQTLYAVSQDEISSHDLPSLDTLDQVDWEGQDGTPWIGVNPFIAFSRESGNPTVIVDPAPLPLAMDDQSETVENEAVTIDVLSNDQRNGGGDLTLTAVDSPANGTVAIVDAQLQYIPNFGFVGEETFDYTVSNGPGSDTTATVSVTVTRRPTVLGRITGQVRNDTDGDGDLSDREKGIRGVTIQLFEDANRDFKPDGDAIATTTTNRKGRYRFNNLTFGHYIVEEINPDGFMSTADANGYNLDRIAGIKVDGKVTGQDFLDTAVSPTGFSISGQVRSDDDGDGDLRGSDLGISDVTIQLFEDKDLNYRPDGDAIATAKTDASGSYRFSGLSNGIYLIEQINLDGFISTADANGYNLDRIAGIRVNGSNVLAQDFLDQPSAIAESSSLL